MERIGPYTVVREIARGAMGVVYEAHEPTLERTVAVKVLLAGGSAEPEDVERFRREARACARLRHPSIVGVHSAGLVQGMPYLVMDFIQGRSLPEWIAAEGTPMPREAAHITRLLARALQYAHDQGVLHRDVKPANVLLDERGQPLLTDFGLARVVGRDERMTATGAILGSPAYIPPEQAMGFVDQVGPVSDVYGLGATLYELLAGRAPYTGNTVINVLNAVVTEDPPALSEVATVVDAPLFAICERAMAREPADRYPDAEAFARALDEYLQPPPTTAPRAAPRGAVIPFAVTAGVIGALLGGGLPWVFAGTPPRPPRDPEIARLQEHLSGLREELRAKQARSPEPESSQTPSSARAQAIELEERAKAREEAKDLRGAADLLDRAVAADPTYAQAHYRRGLVYLFEGDHSEALDCFDRAIQLEPELARYYESRGSTTRLLRRYDEAQRDFARARELNPENPKTHKALFDIHYKREDSPRMIASAREWVRTDRTAQSLASLALALVFSGKMRQAERVTEEALALDDQDPSVLTSKACFEAANGDVRGALEIFDRAIQRKPNHYRAHVFRSFAYTTRGRPSAAIADATRAIEIDPTDHGGYDMLGVAHARAGDLGKARAAIERALELAPRGPIRRRLRADLAKLQGGGTPQRAEAEALAREAVGRFNVRDYTGALNLLDQALAKDPSFAEAHFYRGKLLSMVQRDLEGGLAAYTRAIELNPRVVKYYDARAGAYRQLGRLREALRDYASALELEPGHPMLHKARYGLYFLSEDFPRAIEEATRYAEIEPSAASLSDLALALAHANRLDEAEQALRRAERIDPDTKDVHLARGCLSLSRHDYALAVRKLSRAITLEPSHFAAFAYRSMAHEGLGNEREALADAREAVRLSKGTWYRAHEAVGQAQWRLGDHEQALAAFMRASAKCPQDTPAAKRMGDLIRKLRGG